MPLYTKKQASVAIEAVLYYIHENPDAIEDPRYDEGFLNAYSYLIHKIPKLPKDVYKEIICYCVEVYPLVKIVKLQNKS